MGLVPGKNVLAKIWLTRKCRMTRLNAAATHRPSNAPAPASNRLSVSDWRISRPRPAPRASPTANSRSRTRLGMQQSFSIRAATVRERIPRRRNKMIEFLTPLMKFGVNTFIWAAEFKAEHLALLPAIKANGFDGVEVPLFRPAE